MSSFNKILEKINQQNDKIEDMKKAHMEDLQSEFKNIIKMFFDECPKIQAVLWSQFTPYFNDGDPCIFRINGPIFVTQNFDTKNLRDSYEYEDDDEYASLSVPSVSWQKDINYARNILENNPSAWQKEYYSSNIIKLEEMQNDFNGYDEKIKLFTRLIHDNEDMINKVYGDGVLVYLTPTEVIVEQYSHD